MRGESKRLWFGFKMRGGGRPLCTGKGRLAAAPGSLWFAKRERGAVGSVLLFFF